MYHGHIHIVEFLIASATNADGQTPLMLGTIQGDVNMVKYILQAGADVNRMTQKSADSFDGSCNKWVCENSYRSRG